jgi:hypothetical protein
MYNLQQITLRITEEKWHDTIQFYKKLGFKIVEESNSVYLHYFSEVGMGITLQKGKMDPIEFTIQTTSVSISDVGECSILSKIDGSCW